MSFKAAAIVFERATGAVDDGLDEALSEVGIALHGIVVKTLSQPGSGVTYVRGNVSHVASAPGEPPAVDFGIYRSSWNWVTSRGESGPGESTWSVRGDGLEKIVEVGTSQGRGPALEYGGSPSNIAPRPHLRPSVEEVKPMVRTIVAKHIEDSERAGLASAQIITSLSVVM